MALPRVLAGILEKLPNPAGDQKFQRWLMPYCGFDMID